MSVADKFPDSLPAFQRMFPDDGACASILDAADDEAIIVFAKAKIKFVSRLAHNRAIRRGLEVR